MILLSRGANVSIRGDEGYTALHLAIQSGHLYVIKLLVKAGADFEASTSDGSTCTPLHVATQFGRSGAVAALVKTGADLEGYVHRFTWRRTTGTGW